MAQSAMPSEHTEQVALMTWARLTAFVHPVTGKEARIADYLLAIPNGGDRDARVARKLKAEGVKAGVSDLLLAVPNEGICGLWIELKRRKRAALSPEQRDWLELMDAGGYMAVMAKGWDAAALVICDYLNLDPARHGLRDREPDVV